MNLVDINGTKTELIWSNNKFYISENIYPMRCKLFKKQWYELYILFTCEKINSKYKYNVVFTKIWTHASIIIFKKS